MRGLSGEHFKLVCLDGRKKIIETVDLPLIKQDVNLAQPLRVIIETAITNKARYFIVVHNHSSGDPKPNQNDLDISRNMVFAGMIIQIRLLDHVIFGEDSFFSFANEGLVEQYEEEFRDLKLHGTLEAKRRLERARKAAGKD